MKKVAFLFTAVILSFTVYTSNAQAKLTEETIIQTITKDFMDTHNIQLNNYKFVHLREIAPIKDNTIQQKSLFNIYLSLSEKQIIGDLTPLFYVNKENKDGYVLEKKLSGMNNLYFLSYDNATQTWKVINSSNKMGTDMIDIGLLKSAN